MNNGINNMRYNRPVPTLKETKSGRGKANFSNKLAGGALDTISTVGSILPGGSIISAAAKGVKLLTGAGGSSENDQMDKMWEMQKENQSFNLEYFELQSSMQSDNRRFSTLSNLMKARHDTAKSAINNMNV